MDLSFDDLIPEGDGGGSVSFDDLIPTAPAPARRGTMRSGAQPFVAGQSLPLPEGVAPSRAGGGRGMVNPPAVQPAGMAPPRDRREAIDDAVDRIEMGMPAEEVFSSFEQAGIPRQEIIARGTALGGKAFAPDTRPVTVREGARDGALAAVAPGSMATQLGRAVGRGVEQTGGMADVLALQAGAMKPSDFAERLRERTRRIGAMSYDGDVAAGVERLAQANETGSVGEVLSAMATPEGAKGLVAIIAESVVPSLAAAPAAVAGGLLAGPAGTAAAVGAVSFGLEFASALDEVLAQRGLDSSDAVAVARAVQDPEIMAAARERGVARGLPIAALDAIGAGFAGRFVGTVNRAVEAGQLSGRKATGALAVASAKEAGLQVATGSGGEMLAQAATGENKPLDWMVEGLAEAPGAVFEAGSNLRSQRRAPATIRVEDQPTVPLAPEQVQAMAAAAPKPPADKSMAPSGPPAAVAPSAAPGGAANIGVAGVPQGSLADLVAQQLGGQGVQPDVAVPAGAAPGASDAGSNQPGGSVGAVGPGAAQPAPMGGAAQAPQAGSGPDAAPEDGGLSDPALKPQASVAPFRSMGEAVATQAEDELAARTRVVEVPGQGFVLAPAPRQADAATVQEDQRELDSLNAVLTGDEAFVGTGAKATAVPDAAAPTPLRDFLGLAESAFGVRGLAVEGLSGAGIQFGRRFYVDVKAADTPSMALGLTFHESFHWLEQNDPAAAGRFYDGMEPLLRPTAVGARQAAEQRAANKAGEKTTVTEGQARSEVMADLNGGFALQPEFWERLYELDNGSTFRKVLYQFARAASKMLRVATGGQLTGVLAGFDVRRYVTNVEAAREVAAKVWADRAKGGGKPAKAQAKPAQRKPDDTRAPGETDKEFAKRVVDKRPRPTELPENPDLYFTRPAGTVDLLISDIRSTKSDAENQQGGENGPKRMAAAAAGELSKREPITVMPSIAEPGKFDVVDGNGTVTSVSSFGWQRMPAVVVPREVGLKAIAADKRKDKIKGAAKEADGLVPKWAIDQAVRVLQRYDGPPATTFKPGQKERLERLIAPILEQAEAANEDFKERVRALASQLGGKAKTAPVKSMKRSVEKLAEEEAEKGVESKGDWLKDSVRASIVVASEAEIPAAIEAVKRAFTVIRVKDKFQAPTPAGYRDILTNVDLGDGVIAELQIHIPEMIAAKELGHLLYEVERALPEGSDEKADIQAVQRSFYGAAYETSRRAAASSGDMATSASNASREISTPSNETFPSARGAPVQAERNSVPSLSETTGQSFTSKNRASAGGDFQLSAMGTSEPGMVAGSSSVLAQARGLRELRDDAAVRAQGRAMADAVAKLLKLTPEERASTALDLMTGRPGGEAFRTPLVGDLTETVQFLEDRRRASGLPVLDLENEADRATMAKMMAAETLAAIRAAGNAVEWYDSTIRRMLSMLAVKYPELATDEDARNAMLVATAISSQTMNVEDNLAFAMKQYDAWRNSSPDVASRRFPEVGTGKSAPAMQGNYELANRLFADLGPETFRRFLRTPYTVGQLKKAGFEVNDELVSEEVLGSSVFGPKIGFGFYSNLAGNFEPVTMDMWFMRTIGRLMGKLRGFDEARFAKQLERLRGSLDERGGDGLFADRFPADLVERARTDDAAAVELSRLVDRAHEKDYKDNRAGFDAKTRRKTDLVGAAISIIKSVDASKDAPENGRERRLLRDVVRKTVDLVAGANGQRVPPAALQALIWYPEQELYKALGVKLRVTSQDYAGAAQKVLAEEGFDVERLRAAAEPGSGRARPQDGRDDAGAARGDDQGPGGTRPLDPAEREAFLAARTPAPRARGRSAEVAPAQARQESAPLADPFADGYKPLEGRRVSLEVRIADTGQTATLTIDAAQALRDLDQRADAARRLAACLAA